MPVIITDTNTVYPDALDAAIETFELQFDMDGLQHAMTAAIIAYLQFVENRQQMKARI